MELASRGDLVAVFTVTESDQLMMVTNMGQMIRVMASDISIQGRSASGVRIFDVGHDEYVVSVTKMVEQTDLDE
jgi:DNA gyrase subunit A